MTEGASAGQLEDLTFLFADIERSSQAWLTRSLEMTRCIPAINGIIENTGTDRQGVVFAREGDGRAVYFDDPVNAVNAAIAAQRQIASDPEGTGGLRVRIGLHSGTVYQLSDGDLGGTPLNYSGRLHSVAHGGQIIVSTTTKDMLGQAADEFHWRNLGTYALRDFQPQTLWQLDYHEPPDTSGADQALREHGRDEHGRDEHGRHEDGRHEDSAAEENDASQSFVFPPLKTQRRFENLPPVAADLIGREEELAVLEQSKAGQAVTITGPGGIGKTRLVQAFIERHGHRYRDGVCFVDLVSVVSDEQVADAVASALGIDPAIAATAAESICDALTGSDVLIVLDNCEHIADGVSPIIEAVIRAGGPTIVSTSRVVLGVAGEIVFPLGPLGINNSEGQIGDSEKLFANAAGAARPGFDVDSSHTFVTEICERLGGMPLAIELAAARMSVVQPGDLLALLDDDLAVLDEGSTTLKNAFRWSAQSLDANSQRVGAILANAHPDAALSDLASTANCSHPELLRSLQKLVASGLVQLGSGQQVSRYRMMQPLRRPISELLSDAEQAELRSRQADSYAALALDLGVKVQSSDEVAAVGRLGSEIGNVRAAVLFDIEQGNYDRAAAAIVALHMYGFLRMNYEVYSWTQMILGLNGRASDLPLSDHNRASLVGLSAFRSFNQGDMPTAMQLATTADELTPGDGGQITSRVVLMAGYGMAGDYERANSELNGGLRWCDANEEPFYRTNLHVIASMGLTTQGLFEEAAGLARHGLQLAEKVANPSAVAWALTALADARRVENPAEASALLVSALEIARSVSNQWVSGQALLNLSRSHRSAGELSQSVQVCVDALGHCQQQANRIQSRQGVREAFLLLYHLGEHDHARRVMAPLQKPSDTLPPSPDQQTAVEQAIAELKSSVSPETVTADTALSALGHRSTTAEREALVYARSALVSIGADIS